MTATDELRKLLDERGVEYKKDDSWNHAQQNFCTSWNCDNGKLAAFTEIDYPHMTKLRVYDCTPEQAIAATLGCRTCELELATDMESIRCSSCGYKLPKGTDLKATRFCGGCGCEVER